jgi:hypothetical protein
VRTRPKRPRFSPLLTAAMSWGGVPTDDEAASSGFAGVRSPGRRSCERPRCRGLASDTSSGAPRSRSWSDSPTRGVLVDDLRDQRVDDPQRRGETAGAGGIQEARPEVKSLAGSEAVYPVVNRVASDTKDFGDLFGGLTLGESEQSLGAAPLHCKWCVGHETFQLATEPIILDEREHRITSLHPR